MRTPEPGTPESRAARSQIGVRESVCRFAPKVGMVIATAALAWLAAASGPGWVLPILTLLGCLALVLLSPSLRAIAPFSAGLLLILSSSFSLIPEGSALISTGVRVIGLGLIALSGAQRVSRSSAFIAECKASTLQMRVWLPWLTSSLLVYLLLAAAFHGQWLSFVLYLSGLALLVVAIVITATRVPIETVAKAVVSALAILAVLSLIYALALPTEGIEGGRLRGLTGNANTLGFYAFLLGSLALIVVRRFSVKAALFTLSVIVLIGTSSRASALALTVVVLGVFLTRRSATTVIAVFGLLIAGVVLSMAWPDSLAVLDGLLRDNNSRSGSLDVTAEAFRSSPIVGVGLAADQLVIASSPLRALAYAGLGGLVSVIVLWLCILVPSRKVGIPAIGFAVAAIVHSLFEGWLLSPVSPLLLVFVFSWWVIIRTPPASPVVSSIRRPHTSRSHRKATPT